MEIINISNMDLDFEKLLQAKPDVVYCPMCEDHHQNDSFCQAPQDWDQGGSYDL